MASNSALIHTAARTTPAMASRVEERPDAEMMIFCNPQRGLTTRACPMSLGDYLKLRGWRPDSRQDLNQGGYLVERPDMGPPNQKGFHHFIAWLPKENFERFYEPIGPMNS